jgi:hypothetical protein
MIPHLVDYQLVILVLLWLCLMVPHLWPSPDRGSSQDTNPAHQAEAHAFHRV